MKTKLFHIFCDYPDQLNAETIALALMNEHPPTGKGGTTFYVMEIEEPEKKTSIRPKNRIPLTYSAS